MDAIVLAHIGHHWSSVLYVIPFIVFFWLVLRERARARRAAEQSEESAGQRRGEPSPLEPR